MTLERHRTYLVDSVFLTLNSGLHHRGIITHPSSVHGRKIGHQMLVVQVTLLSKVWKALIKVSSKLYVYVWYGPELIERCSRIQPFLCFI